MATDPVPSLMAIAKQTPDPRAIARWIDAYLGTRPLDAKASALRMLEAAFDAKQHGKAEPDKTDARAAGMVVRIVQRMLADMDGGGGGKAKGRGK